MVILSTNIKLAEETWRCGPALQLLEHLEKSFEIKYDKVSKDLLDEINHELLKKTKLLQFKSTKDALNWFKDIDNKPSFTFIQFDVQAMYPSISKHSWIRPSYLLSNLWKCQMTQSILLNIPGKALYSLMIMMYGLKKLILKKANMW